MRVDIAVQNAPPLVLRVGVGVASIGQIRPQETADVGDLGIADRGDGGPKPEGRRVLIDRRAVHAVIVDTPVRRVVVGVQRRERGQFAILKHCRALRPVAAEGEVEAELQVPAAERRLCAVLALEVPHLLKMIRKALTFPAEGQGLLQPADLWQVEHEGALITAVFAAREAEHLVSFARRGVDDLDHADKGVLAQRHGGGALQHLDTVDIVEVEGRDRRVERAAPGHAVHYQQKGVKLVQAPEARHRAGGPCVAAGRRLDARDQGHCGAQVVRAAVGEILPAHPRDHGGDPLFLHRNAGRGNDDGGERVRRLIRLRRPHRADPGNTGQQAGRQRPYLVTPVYPRADR